MHDNCAVSLNDSRVRSLSMKMNLVTSRSIQIGAQPSAVWAVIADIENAESHISGIKKIEILAPAAGDDIVGLKWRETREWMGQEAIEVMWVTDAEAPVFYETRAENHGCIYKSRFELAELDGSTTLTMAFYCQPQTLGARLMWRLTGWMARRSLAKVMTQDLDDIRAAVENAKPGS